MGSSFSEILWLVAPVALIAVQEAPRETKKRLCSTAPFRASFFQRIRKSGGARSSYFQFRGRSRRRGRDRSIKKKKKRRKKKKEAKKKEVKKKNKKIRFFALGSFLLMKTKKLSSIHSCAMLYRTLRKKYIPS